MLSAAESLASTDRSNANLSDADLALVDLTGTNLSDAMLTGATGLKTTTVHRWRSHHTAPPLKPCCSPLFGLPAPNWGKKCTCDNKFLPQNELFEARTSPSRCGHRTPDTGHRPAATGRRPPPIARHALL